MRNYSLRFPVKSATATIVPFEVMIGHNSRADCARESVKTSSDPEDSNRSDEFKKSDFTFEIIKKNANLETWIPSRGLAN